MDIEKNSNDYYEKNLKKITEFTQEQHKKVSSLIESNNQFLSGFKPFKQAEEIQTQTAELMQLVNDELDKAMANLDNQISLVKQPINQS